jgi:hypothetical protein
MAASTDRPTLDPAQTYLVFHGGLALAYELPATLTDYTRHNVATNRLALDNVINRYMRSMSMPTYKNGASRSLDDARLFTAKELYSVLWGRLPAGMSSDLATLIDLFSELHTPALATLIDRFSELHTPAQTPPPETDIETALNCLRRLARQSSQHADRIIPLITGLKWEEHLVKYGRLVAIVEISNPADTPARTTYYSHIPEEAISTLEGVRRRWGDGMKRLVILETAPDETSAYRTYADLKAKLAELELGLP